MRKNRIRGVVCGHRRIASVPIDGRWFRLNQNPEDPLRFVCVNDGKILTPPDGFTHDFGSIPLLAQFLLGGPGGHPEWAQHAAYVYPLHDHAYERRAWDDGTPMSRIEADELLYAALWDRNCAEWYCAVVYAAVRLGGAWHWKNHSNHNPPTYGGKP